MPSKIWFRFPFHSQLSTLKLPQQPSSKIYEYCSCTMVLVVHGFWELWIADNSYGHTNNFCAISFLGSKLPHKQHEGILIGVAPVAA